MPEIILKPDYYKYHEFQLSYSTGLSIQLKTNRKTDFTIGMQFTNERSIGKEQAYVTERDLSRPVFDTLISTEKWKYSNRILEVPFVLNFKLGGKGILYSINPGFSITYLINRRFNYVYVYKDGHTMSGQFLATTIYGQRIDILPQVSFGVEKEISDDYFVKIEPTLKLKGAWEFIDHFDYDYLLLGINFTLVKQLY